jgi:anti-anti-sigma factor
MSATEKPAVGGARDCGVVERERRPGGTVVLAVSGYLNAEGSPTLQDELAKLLKQGARHVELDCSAVRFISSVGVGVLIVAVGDFRGVGGDVVVTGLNDELRHMFDMLELGDYVTLR